MIMVIASRRVNRRVNRRINRRVSEKVSEKVTGRISIPQNQKPLLLFLVCYLVYLFWVFNSADTASAFFSLRLRLPLLVIPLVVFTSQPLSRRDLQWVFGSFIAGVTLSTIAGVILFYRGNGLLLNTRDLSLFISHIRLSLMICFSLVVLFDFFARQPLLKTGSSRSSGSSRSGFLRSGVILLSLWLVVYMFMVVALTGLIILAVLLFFILFNYILSSRKRSARIVAIVITVIIVTLPVIYISVMITDYLDMKEPAIPDYTLITASGRDYSQHRGLYGRENGYYTWNYICEEELENGWDSISTIPYSGIDSLGNEIRITLIRYLTSLGLKKDSVGLASLSEADIRTVEKGYSNSRYLNGTGLHDRIYEIIWQIDHFAGGGNPQGHSVTQRLLFLKNGWRVFMRYPLLGTGTGDYNNEVAWQYEADNTILDPEFRKLPHNQFLTSLGTFGIAGALLFWLFMLLPALISGSFRKPLFIFFFLTMFLSMLTEDTLETHTGVTLFALFYSLLLLPPAVKGNRASNSDSDQ